MAFFRPLFEYKAWANRDLFAVLQDLDASRHADLLHSALRTLNHIYVVDRIFRAHLLGQAHGYSATNTPETPTLDALQRDVADTDAWYLEYVARLSAPQADEPLQFCFTDGDTGTMSRAEMLLHVHTHGAYHRGNVGQMLKGAGLAPPRDLLTKFWHQSEPQRRGVTK